MRAHRVLLWLIVIAAPLALAKPRAIPVRIEPPQRIAAITLRNGEDVRPVDVRDGKALVPEDLPLPWTLGMQRFERVTYTRDDLAQGRPLLLRELGRVHGTIQRPREETSKRFLWLSARTAANTPDETKFEIADDGSFELRMPAGVHHAAAVGEHSASRIRTGIVIAPGRTTELGAIVCEPTAPVSVRVVDAKRGTPIPRAQVRWDAPEALNAKTAAILYQRLWSGITDARGIATIRAVGPPPIPLRWHIEADGYAPQRTARVLLSEARPVAVPDTRLHRQSTLIVDVEGELKGATLVLGELESDETRRYRPTARTALHAGETKFVIRGEQRRRIWIETADGKPLLYRDVEIQEETERVRLAIEPVEIHGTVQRNDDPVPGTIVRVADVNDPRFTLALARSEKDGSYALTTYQSGMLSLYAIEPGRPGASSGSMSQSVNASGWGEYRVDFELPSSGLELTVVDAATGTPVEAEVDTRLKLRDGRGRMEFEKTDEQGRLILSGYSDGTASLTITADGYRSRTIEAELKPAAPPLVVKLERAPPLSGRVVDAYGAPIHGASITAGYDSILAMQGTIDTITDAQGRFTVKSAPDPGTLFYIVAPHHALTIAELAAGRENVIRLSPPAPGRVLLMPDNAPPVNVHMVVAAPRGRDFIPFGALHELADANGLTQYQLLGSSKDGSSILPAFLAPGTYDLFLAMKGAEPFRFHRIGSVTTPLARDVPLAYKAP